METGGNWAGYASLSVCIVECLIEFFLHFSFEFNVLEFEWLRTVFTLNGDNFRLKLLECLIENFVHFRFELNVLELTS